MAHKQSTQTSLQQSLNNVGYELNDAFNEWLIDRTDLTRRLQSLVRNASPPYYAVYQTDYTYVLEPRDRGAPRRYIALFPDQDTAQTYARHMQTSVIGETPPCFYYAVPVTKDNAAEIPDTEYLSVCGPGGSEFATQERGYTKEIARRYAAVVPGKPEKDEMETSL